MYAAQMFCSRVIKKPSVGILSFNKCKDTLEMFLFNKINED